ALAVRRMLGWLAGAAVIASGLALFAGRWAVGPVASEPLNAGGGNTQALGQALYTRYLFPFEITSLVLLVAMVGAIVISRGRREEEGRATLTLEPVRPSIALAPGDSFE